MLELSGIDGRCWAAGSRSCRISHGIKIDEQLNPVMADPIKEKKIKIKIKTVFLGSKEKAKPSEPRSRPRGRLESSRQFFALGSGAGLSFPSQLDSMTSCWSRGRRGQWRWFLGKSRLVTRLADILLAVSYSGWSKE